MPKFKIIRIHLLQKLRWGSLGNSPFTINLPNGMAATHLVLFPVTPQLHVPLEGVGGVTAGLYQRADHVPGVHAHHDERPHTAALQLGKLGTPTGSVSHCLQNTSASRSICCDKLWFLRKNVVFHAEHWETVQPSTSFALTFHSGQEVPFL